MPDPAERTLRKTLLMRLGEGLVVGLGAAIAFGAYTAMNKATEELQRTRSILEKQAVLNQGLKDKVADTARLLDQERGLLEQQKTLAANVESLANRLRILEVATARRNPALKLEKMDWSRFEKEKSAISIPKLREDTSREFDHIQRIIDDQSKLRR